MATAASLTQHERDALSPEAERRLDSLLSFDEDADDLWDDWPYEHYPGEACALDPLEASGPDEDGWDEWWDAHEAYWEPKRRSD